MNIDINFFDEILKEAKKTNELVNLINEEYSKVDVLMYNKFGSNSIWNNHFMNIYDYIYDELQTKNDEIKYNANRAYCIFKYSDFPTIFEDFDEKLNIESYFSFNSLLQASYGNIKIYDLLSFDIDNSGPFNENSKIIVLRGKLLEAFLYCFSQELIKGEKPDFLNATNYNYEGDTIYSVELNYDGLIEYYKKHRDEELLSQLDSFSFEEIDKKELIINDLLSSINLFLENQIKLNNIFPDKTLNIGSTDSMTESKILNITTDDLLTYYQMTKNIIVFSVNSFTHFATASSDGTISFYQSCNDLNWYIKDTMYHEAAHLLDYKINISSSEQWINASKQDVSYPSDYAQSNQKENWAESVAYYYADPIKFKKEFPNRTIIIEEILEINSKENFELAKNN